MSTRHLSRCISKILKVVDPIATREEYSKEPLLDERNTLSQFAEHLRGKAPEQIRAAAWEHAEPLVLEIIGFLDEPHRGKAEAIWTGDTVAVVAGHWKWRLAKDDRHPGRWSLVSPDGVSVAATVEPGRGPSAEDLVSGTKAQRADQSRWVSDGDVHGWYWFLWDPSGVGGENSKEDYLDAAKWSADRAARVWWHEEGWGSPSGPYLAAEPGLATSPDGESAE